MVSKHYVCENDKTTNDAKAGDDEVEESVLGYQKTWGSLMLPRTGVSFLLIKYSGQP